MICPRHPLRLERVADRREDLVCFDHVIEAQYTKLIEAVIPGHPEHLPLPVHVFGSHPGPRGHRAWEVPVPRRPLFHVVRNLTRMSEELGSLEFKLEARSRELADALQQQSATADILRTISRSNVDLPAVLNPFAGVPFLLGGMPRPAAVHS